MTGRIKPLEPGTMVQEYRIEHVLGSGGFGIVYRAGNMYLDETVAIKEFLPSELAHRIDATKVAPISADTEEPYKWALNRFLREARLLWTLGRPTPHRNIVKVARFHEGNGTAYMVMEYEEGQPLGSKLKQQGTIPEEELKSILFPLLDGLERVHEAEVLHRDIKPGNILIRPDGSPVLIDFGAARPDQGGEHTRSMMSVYSPKYAPPEQMAGAGKQGPWTDIYSLGATLYHAVTGKPPTSPLARMQGSTHNPVVDAVASAYSATFLNAIDKAIEPATVDRPQTIAQFRALLKGEQISDKGDATLVVAHPKRTITKANPPQEVSVTQVTPKRAQGVTQAKPKRRQSDAAQREEKQAEPHKGSGSRIGFILTAISLVTAGAVYLFVGKRAEDIEPPLPQDDRVVIQSLVEETVQTFECSYLKPSVRDDLSVQVSGHVSKPKDVERLRDQLREIDKVKDVATDVVVYEPPFCEVAALLRSRQPADIDPNEAVKVEFNNPSRMYKEGELLKVSVTANSAFDGYLYVDYLDSAGNVVHMFPTPLRPDNSLQAGQEVTLGDADPNSDKRTYQIVPPHGRNMIVAMYTDEPLFDAPREELEPVAEYLAELSTGLDTLPPLEQFDGVPNNFDFIVTHQ